MKYPAVFRDTDTSSSGDSNQQTVLIYQDGDAIHLAGKFKGQYTARWSTFNAINITREYLQNTYGEVVSPEHAEFIIELAKSAGFELNTGPNEDYPCWFAFDDELYFFDSKAYASDNSRKQIKIPLPPKAESKKWNPDFYELSKPPKYFDCMCNKCGGKCCTGQCDKQESSDWPQVGDEVVTCGGSKGVVKISEQDKDGMIVCDFDGEYALTYKSDLSKPKTPEDELRDDIVWLTIKHMENKSYPIENNAYYLFSDLMGKYNITKKA
ncbi:hypothetical protein [Pseudoalteromonas phage PHS3]|nr:hypothetical protein [Pseudoalteromonas phage PHS3]